jgi:hypothetical protein
LGLRGLAEWALAHPLLGAGDTFEDGGARALPHGFVDGGVPDALRRALAMAIEARDAAFVSRILADPRLAGEAEEAAAAAAAAAAGAGGGAGAAAVGGGAGAAAVGGGASARASAASPLFLAQSTATSLFPRGAGKEAKEALAILEALLAHPAFDPGADCSGSDAVADALPAPAGAREPPLRLLTVAARAGSARCVKRLLADPRVDPSADGAAVLLAAAASQDEETFRAILDDARVDLATHGCEAFRVFSGDWDRLSTAALALR